MFSASNRPVSMPSPIAINLLAAAYYAVAKAQEARRLPRSSPPPPMPEAGTSPGAPPAVRYALDDLRAEIRLERPPEELLGEILDCLA